MQTLELFLIGGLILLQLYVFSNVLKKSKLISSILPNKQSISIDRVVTTNSPIEDKTSNEDTLDFPKGKHKMLYFSTMEKMNDEEGYFFKEADGSTNGIGFVKLEFDESSIFYYPNCNTKRIKMISTNSFFQHIFNANQTKGLNETDNVICRRRGECTAIPGGWKVIRKAIIEY